jgi:hypothetical protein
LATLTLGTGAGGKATEGAGRGEGTARGGGQYDAGRARRARGRSPRSDAQSVRALPEQDTTGGGRLLVSKILRAARNPRRRGAPAPVLDLPPLLVPPCSQASYKIGNILPQSITGSHLIAVSKPCISPLPSLVPVARIQILTWSRASSQRLRTRARHQRRARMLATSGDRILMCRVFYKAF